MIYQVARIFCLDFGSEGVAVGDCAHDHGMFAYDPIFPQIGVDDLSSAITDDDVLIANPSFSHFNFGLNCRGRKLMYAQGFNTFSLIDPLFDRYVAASRVVNRLLAGVYDIETKIIPPFIGAENFASPSPWRSRRPASVLMSGKSPPHLVAELCRRLAAKGLEPTFEQPFGRNTPHEEIIARMGEYRYFLTLSPAEGFGLMPLEAMAMGCVVMGFDGYGGRDYMSPDHNCAVTRYGDFGGLASRIARALGDENFAASLACAGRATGMDPGYHYDRFRDAWRREIAEFLKQPRAFRT